MENNNDYYWRKRETAVPSGLGNITRLTVKSATGATVIDVDGKQYIDFAGGIGVMNVGHNHPKVVKAIVDQANRLIQPCFHVMMHEPYLALAQKLNEITPGSFAKQTMLCNSGAEAVENAIKIARFYTGRSSIISFEKAFHGRTYMGMSLTSKVKPYKFGFGQMMPDIWRLPYPAEGMGEKAFLDAWQHLVNYQVASEDIAAIILEPELGEGGFIPADPMLMKCLRQLCDKHGIILIIDEIQSGFARTGKLFATEHFDIEADILTMGKSLSSGMPLSALTVRKTLADNMPAFSLGGTNSGNPIACAAALASLEIIEKENLCLKAEHIGKRVKNFFHKQKQQHDCIGDIRGLGAMIGIEFISKHGEPNPEILKKLLAYCLKHGLLLLSAGSHKQVLRTLMPLVITDDELDRAFSILTDGLAMIYAEGFSRQPRSPV
ncbi:MAG: aspartate aminotransferase family protein [Francisellaceae bacterium]